MLASRNPILRSFAASIASTVLLLAFPAMPDEVPAPHGEFDESLPRGGARTGKEIYQSFLNNKFRRGVQLMRVVSSDPGGSEQTTTFSLSHEDLRDDAGDARNGIKMKMLVEISAPFDMRHTQYLMISKDPGPDDAFVYQPSQRRVKRVNLRRAPLMGTDFTFDDLAYHDIENATYKRLPDEVIDGTPVYVVEAFINDTLDVEYHRTISYMEMEHYVPIRVRYWDAYGVEVKEMTAPAASVKSFSGTWVATISTMRDLLQNTSSRIHVDDLDTNPTFPPKLFTVARMNQGK